jgi:hypothetical protein
MGYSGITLSKKKLTEAIDKVAAKQFNDMLKQEIIDTDAFHKAYDTEIKKEASSNPDFDADIFIADQNDINYGCLKDRGTYKYVKACTDVSLQRALKKL